MENLVAAPSPTFKGPTGSARVSGSLRLPDGLTTLPSSLFDVATVAVPTGAAGDHAAAGPPGRPDSTDHRLLVLGADPGRTPRA